MTAGNIQSRNVVIEHALLRSMAISMLRVYRKETFLFSLSVYLTFAMIYLQMIPMDNEKKMIEMAASSCK